MDANLKIKIREQKNLARQNRSMRNYLLLLCVLLGITLSISWALLDISDSVTYGTKFLIGIGLGAIGGNLLFESFKDRLCPRRAACPACGFSWEIKEGRHIPLKEYMPYWDKCPGCGLLINEALLDHVYHTEA